MRRILAILLFAAIGFPAVAPLLALGETPDAHLPACCRRNGAHHCMMPMAAAANTPVIGARCPRCPQPQATAPHSQAAAFSTARSVFTTPILRITAPGRAATQRRISRERSRHKRGPPAAILLAA